MLIVVRKLQQLLLQFSVIYNWNLDQDSMMIIRSRNMSLLYGLVGKYVASKVQENQLINKPSFTFHFVLVTKGEQKYFVQIPGT